MKTIFLIAVIAMLFSATSNAQYYFYNNKYYQNEIETMNGSLNVRFEIVHRILFTDYLDDVSTDYINPNLFSQYLPARQAAIAKQLYGRKKELNPFNESLPGD